MILLPNGCRASEIRVTPSNWQTQSTLGTWFIRYQFYDPVHGMKQIVIKGMNRVKDLSARRQLVRELLANEKKILEKGYNPFTGVVQEMPTISQGLWSAFKSVDVAPWTRRDLKSTILSIDKALVKLSLQHALITQLSRGMVKSILTACSTTKDRFNKHRTNLKILISDLIESEVIGADPTAGIKKKKTLRVKRDVLTPDQQIKINDHLKNYPAFHRFLHIFFHSGARVSELMRIQGKHVNLYGQTFRVVINKGQRPREVEKVIKNACLPYWKLAVENCLPEEYVFSKGLVPGVKPVQSYQISKRWYRLVKKKLNVTADFYSLKHLNTDQTSEMLSLQEASRHNDHKGTVITMKYAVTEEQRMRERIKKLDNKFA